MEARGYRGGEGRTKYRLLKWRAADTLALISIVFLSGILVVIRS